MRMMSAFGRAVGTLGIGLLCVAHGYWSYQDPSQLSRVRTWEMPLELYIGIFLVGVGTHAVAFWCWFNYLRRSRDAAPSSVDQPN